MKLNPINLTVNDVQEASDFLINYFGMRSMGGNKGRMVLTCLLWRIRVIRMAFM